MTVYQTPIRVVIFLLLVCIAISAACAAQINLQDQVRLSNDQAIKAIYYYPHWWDPWKSDDAAVGADLAKMKQLGFNTICLDHEVSQAVDREWYWLDREYQLANKENMYILPWLQLQAIDRVNLMKFSHLQLKQAVTQDGKAEEDCVVYRDGEFAESLAHYINVYLDRYEKDPALVRIKDGKKFRPMVGLMLETGWRNPGGMPLSFDEESNNYFRRWMKAYYHDLKQLNDKWGTSYKSFEEIDPMDKSIFDYTHSDKKNMPVAVQEHTHFRSRLISDALADVINKVRKKHSDVVFVLEIAYPFGSDASDAEVYRWNDANEYKAVENADVILVRGLGGTTSGEQEKEHKLMMLNGKKIIQAYRLFDNTSPTSVMSSALDCAVSANGLAYYNWNEMADNTSALYNKPERQSMAGMLINAYDMLYNPALRHIVPVAQPVATPVASSVTDPANPPAAVPATEEKKMEATPTPAEPFVKTPATEPDKPAENTAPAAGQLAPAVPVPGPAVQ